ncbi:MAG TPA: hypothetical protein VFE66_09905, partial [Bacteroidales bacterium]|nr:hypothetical protein [Bacteroidales bacterium]
FVGIQLAWNLRPFLCEKHEEFKIFRKYEGNFYTAIIYSVEQLVSPTANEEKAKMKKTRVDMDSTNHRGQDTTILRLLKK